ncbi:MAG: DUF4372 domain-containing protein [Deltaproteobacteria bacterium]|nr:DUF4372 domain-containing protein [Deltaproteobacteria bacterium]
MSKVQREQEPITNHVTAVLGQFLALLPRYEFQRIGNKYNGDYRTKHFKYWDQPFQGSTYYFFLLASILAVET